VKFWHSVAARIGQLFAVAVERACDDLSELGLELREGKVERGKARGVWRWEQVMRPAF